MKIISVVGARPNFMKIAPFIKAINDYNRTDHGEIHHILVHTGQHYDDRMSKSFFESLEIPEADINLGIGSGSHAEQVGKTMIAFEQVLIKEKPDWVVVVGDVNATLACSVTAKKEHIKVAHIEAGLRSGDISMPEEINRLVTDRLSDLLLTPDLISNQNLLAEGVDSGKVEFVGNIMIDTLESNRNKATELNIRDIIANNLVKANHVPQMDIQDYAVITMHRPSNVDQRKILEPIIRFLVSTVASERLLLWPIHPRTYKQLVAFDLLDMIEEHPNIVLLQPLGYHDMLRINMDAKIMLTDSGGLQEECCVLGTPCLTLRWNTERPVTLQEHGGASVLVGNDIDKIKHAYQQLLSVDRVPSRPQLWDGKTAERIVDAIVKRCNL
ncbi:non-hydrolyzing UDP-N-acetylglucosamine 2-epimerase [Saccharicrinis sp. GN24d3]|uniref:non-hydrolyzing UDP-N-acetylglucosamine 2-epimerase n=1 Tax=Saccharicrinis sp. GN24d3 TaxID=3458416 RepID=UPI00403725CA